MKRVSPLWFCTWGLIACSNPAPTYLSREALLDSETCGQCHPDHYREWSGSMHAYAAQDPVFIAMNQRGQRETQGALGDFCVSCHAPMAVREGATRDGLDLDLVPDKLKGVTCFFCHTADRVEGAHNNPIGLGDITMRGPFADALPNRAHPSAYSELHDRDRAASASLCGTCHDIVNPQGAAIERTYSEWQGSVFAHSAGSTCGQCHMNQSGVDKPVAAIAGAQARRYHAHDFPGVDVALTDFPEREAQRVRVQEQLDTTLKSALCVSQSATAAAAIRVILDNVGAGHGFPSGAAQDRRVWTEVIAYKDGEIIYESGVVADGTPVATLADPDLWLLRDCMHDANGAPVDMFWEAVSTTSNVLPGQVTFDPLDPRFYETHVVQAFPRALGSSLGVAPDRVTLRVRVQPIGLEVLDSLIAGGDLAPEVRDAIPTFDVALGSDTTLEWTRAKATAQYLEQGVFPVDCVTESNLNVVAAKTPAGAAVCR